MLPKGFLGQLSGWVTEQTGRDNAAREGVADAFDLYKHLDNTNEQEKIIGLFSEWLVFDRKQKIFDNQTGLEFFTSHNPLHLSDDELRAYRDLLKFEVGLFEVKKVEAGKGVVLESIARGNKNFVHDISASLSLKPNETVWTRIASVGGVYYAVGSFMLSMPVKIMAGMREAISGWKQNSFDACQAAQWVTGSDGASDVGISDLSLQFKTYAETEVDFIAALQRCGMENFFTVETYREWVTNEKKYKPGFAARALDCLIPDDVRAADVELLVASSGEFVNNIPRASLKGKTPNEAIREKTDDKFRRWELDIFSKKKYFKDLESAHEYMAKGNFKTAYKVFESVIKDLLSDEIPFFHAFRIYTNVAICCFHLGNGNEMLGEELLNAALRMNPLYDFASQCKEKYVDRSNDFSQLSEADRKTMALIRTRLLATGKRQYQHRVFCKYERFLRDAGVSLLYKTKTIPTVYKDGAVVRTKIGRNEPCYCGSGKKFKKCCG